MQVDTHWREFLHSLEVLSTRMEGGMDLERALATVPNIIGDAIAHAHKSAPWLSAQVSAFTVYTFILINI